MPVLLLLSITSKNIKAAFEIVWSFRCFDINQIRPEIFSSYCFRNLLFSVLKLNCIKSTRLTNNILFVAGWLVIALLEIHDWQLKTLTLLIPEFFLLMLFTHSMRHPSYLLNRYKMMYIHAISLNQYIK